MVKRRCRDAALDREISCHSFRASGITIFRKNGGKLETARQMANQASARTTQLCDHREDAVTLEEITRIRF